MKEYSFEDYKELVEEHLMDFIPEVDHKSITLYESMKYSLTAGGKRIRPVLLLAACDFAGGDIREALPYACAMEYIHTYSMIHDDLPAMDNDDYRRGRKTTHVVYGEDMGILAGDALLNYAFETAFHAFELCPQDSLKIGKALQVLGEKAGIYGMIGGQVIDVKETGKQIDREVLDTIYELKTSALIEASMMVGAILAGATDEELEKVEQMASNIGIAFQVQDDILDVTSTEEVLGKPIHSDEKNEKTTYVTLYGIEKASAVVEERSKEAIALLHELPGENDYLEELIIKLIHRVK